jgi:stress response protein YsnF
MQSMTIDQLQEARGLPVYDSAGDKIGEVEEIFYDEQTNEPVWIGIGTGFFGTKRVLVPVDSAQLEPDGLRVPYDKDKVKDSPDIDSDEISPETEAELYSYYGLTSPQPASYTGDTTQEGTVTRSEEELLVGKRDVEVGRARLRKWVETEPVAVDVELQRETARVVCEPVNQPTDAEIGAEEVEVGLRSEEPVVAKQTVAKERIGLEKDVDTTQETVGGEVRKERVEVEGDTVDR